MKKKKPSIEDVMKHDAIVEITKDDYLRIAACLKLQCRLLREEAFKEEDSYIREKLKTQFAEYEETLGKIYRLIDVVFPLYSYDKF